MDTVNLNIPYIPLEEIEQAAARLDGSIRRTPLVELDVQDLVRDDRRVFLKLENMQHTGSFKARGAGNAVLSLLERQEETIRDNGVFTGSSGNFGQGLAYHCNRLKVPCTVVAPDNATELKVRAIQRRNASVVYWNYDDWWDMMELHKFNGLTGTYIPPICNRDSISACGTVGFEIAEDLDKFDVLLAPFGGGGLSTGIGSALKFLQPDCKLYITEVETSAPLEASFEAGFATRTKSYRRSFCDGTGVKSILPEMWPLITSLIKDSLVVNLDDVAEAVRIIFDRCHTVVEGTGASPLAAALGWHQNPDPDIDFKDKTIVIVISGGNIDPHVYAQILNGETP